MLNVYDAYVMKADDFWKSNQLELFEELDNSLKVFPVAVVASDVEQAIAQVRTTLSGTFCVKEVRINRPFSF